MPVTVRVAGLLVHRDHILLVKHRTHAFWILPGGKLDQGESLAGCVERELREETGLRVKAEDPLFLGDFVSGFKLDIVFRVRLAREAAELPKLTLGDDTNLAAVEWWPTDRPPKIGPPPLGDFLVKTKFDPEAWQGRLRYGGSY